MLDGEISMNEIVAHYGKVAVAAVSVILIMAIVFGMTLSKRPLMSQASEKGSIRYSEEKIDSKRTEYQESSKELKLETARDITTGQFYDIKELFSDHDIMDIRLIQINSVEGVDVTEKFYQKNRVNFSKEGIYKLKVWAEKEDGSFGTECLYIGVGSSR
jgi:hypothetical protein